MTKQRNSCDREFELEDIEMITEHKRKIPEVATEFGIGKTTLKTWFILVKQVYI